jgi:uracil phosphoribosyltransferase
MVDTSELCFVPILRAGLGMVDGMLELVPNAKVGHLGLYRNEETHQPVEYFCKLPKTIARCDVFLIDPMLATGGSAIDAVKTLKKYGVNNISFPMQRKFVGFTCYETKYPDSKLGVFWDLKGV